MPLRTIDYQLLDAAKSGDVSALNAALSAKADLHAKDDRPGVEGKTPIHLAVQNGHAGVVDILLKQHKSAHSYGQQKVKIDVTNLLSVAASNGHTVVVDSLLKHNDSDYYDREVVDINNLLSVSVQNSHTEVVKILLKRHDSISKSSDPTKVVKVDVTNLLSVAVRNGYAEVVDILLEHNRSTCSYGQQAVGLEKKNLLLVAYQNGYAEVMKILLKHRCYSQVDIINLSLAASQNGHAEVVKILLDHWHDSKININYLLLVPSQRGHSEVVDVLLKHYDDKCRQSSDYSRQTGEINLNNLLLVASQGGYAKIVEILLKRYDDKRPQSSHYGSQTEEIDIKNLLLEASQNGHAAVVDRLLKHNDSATGYQDRKIAAIDEKNLLLVASQNGHAGVVDILLTYIKHAAAAQAISPSKVEKKQVGDEHLQDSSKISEIDVQNLLLVAAHNGHVAVLNVLLKNGASYEAALLQAAKNGLNEAVAVLIKNGAPSDAALLQAAQNGLNKEVAVLIKNGAPSDAVLLQAAQHGLNGVVAMLLKNGASSDAVLLQAAQHGLNEVVAILIKNGVSSNAGLLQAAQQELNEAVTVLQKHGASSDAVLLQAAQSGLNKAVVVLLKHGVPPSGRALFLAVENGHTEIVRFLLARRDPHMNIEVKDANGQTPLIKAASCGHIAIVELLLARGAAIDAVDHKGNMAIHVAAANGHYGIIEELLVTGKVPVDILGEDGMSPLMLAVKNCHVQSVQILLEEKANVSKKIKDATILHTAIASGRDDIVESLIKAHKAQDVSIDVEDGSGMTALMSAVQKGHERITGLLLTGGANVAKKVGGSTPLHTAVQIGRADIVENLVRAHKAQSASIDVEDKRGMTTLMSAVQKGSEQITAILLNGGADFEKQSSGTTPLHAAVRNGFVNIVTLLLDKAANVGKKVGDAMPLHAAVICGRDDMVTVILKAHKVQKASIDAEDGNGMTALMSAVQKGHINIIKLLLDESANVAKKVRGTTPLHTAVQIGRADIVEILVNAHMRQGIPVDIEDEVGTTALMSGVQKGYVAITQLLLKGGAVVGKKVGGTTVLHVAAEKGYTNIMAALLKYTTSVDLLREDARTPLMCATTPESATLLLDKGAAIKQSDKKGNTVLHIAVCRGDEKLMKCLLARYKSQGGVTVDIPGEGGKTPLMYADNPAIAALLIKEGACIGAKTNKGYGVLHIASELGHKNFVEYLLNLGVLDVNAAGNDGKTPIMCAADAEIKHLLLDHGASQSANPTKILAASPSMMVPILAQVMSILSEKSGIESVMGLLASGMATICRGPAEAQKAVPILTQALAELTRKSDIPEAVIESLSSVLANLCPEVSASGATERYQVGVPYDGALSSSGASSSASSSSAPSPTLSDAGLQGRGEDSMTSGVSPGEIVAHLSAKGLQCQIEFSRYENLPETVLSLGSKALIELIGDGPAHWVLKFTLEEKVLLIWPGEVPHETLVSATQVGIVVVSIHQNPEECAAAVLNYLATLEAPSSSSSASGQLLIESNEKAPSIVTEVADGSIETCVEVSNSFFEMIIKYVLNFDPRSFVQQQLHDLQELLQDGLSNVWLSAAQTFQLQALLADVRGSLFVPMPPFKPHHDDHDDNYDGGDDPHKNDADQDPFMFFGMQSDKDTVELTGKDQNATLTQSNDGSIS